MLNGKNTIFPSVLEILKRISSLALQDEIPRSPKSRYANCLRGLLIVCPRNEVTEKVEEVSTLGEMEAKRFGICAQLLMPLFIISRFPHSPVPPFGDSGGW